MEIKLQFSGNVNLRSQAIHDIIVGATKCLRAFVEIYREATPEAIQKYFKENGDAEAGEIPEELFLEHLDSILSNIDVDKLVKIDRDIGHLGSKTPVEKYWASMEFLAVLVQDMKQHISAYNTYTDTMLETLRDNLKSYIGDLTYSLACNAFDPYTNVDVIETEEPIVCDQMLSEALAELYPGDSNAVVSYANELANLQEEFATSAPISDLDPDAWKEMTESCTPDISMQLADYGKYITSLDVRAFKSGYLEMDANFIDTLISRKNCVQFMGNVIPNTWANFVKLIPEELFDVFYDVELSIPQDLVKISVDGGKLDMTLFNNLVRELHNGGTGNGYTSVF